MKNSNRYRLVSILLAVVIAVASVSADGAYSYAVSPSDNIGAENTIMPESEIQSETESESITEEATSFEEESTTEEETEVEEETVTEEESTAEASLFDRPTGYRQATVRTITKRPASNGTSGKRMLKSAMRLGAAPPTVLGAPSTVTLPSAYDARNDSIVPPIRNQGDYGTCWAFSTLGCAEISMAKHGYVNPLLVDYSERHLCHFLYNRVGDPLGNTSGDHIYNTSTANDYNVGGNLYFATWLFSQWCGPAEEAVAPYDRIAAELAGSVRPPSSSYMYPGKADMKQALFLSETGRPADIDTIKRAIYDYGAVGASYLHSLSTTLGTYIYNYDESITTTNHAIVLIGWDDNISKDLFGTDEHRPQHDGAFLMRGSFGDLRDMNGYFWISYEDVTLQDLVAYDFEPHFSASNNYYYDGGASVTTSNIPSGSSVANVFTSKAEHEKLKKVTLALDSSDVLASVQVYKNPTDASDPTSGEPCLTNAPTYRTSGQGYYTMDLGEEIELNYGDKFAIVYTLTGASSSAENIELYVDAFADYDWCLMDVAEVAGTSFEQVGTWEDVAQSGYGYTYRIHGITTDVVPHVEPTRPVQEESPSSQSVEEDDDDTDTIAGSTQAVVAQPSIFATVLEDKPLYRDERSREKLRILEINRVFDSIPKEYQSYAIRTAVIGHAVAEKMSQEYNSDNQ